MVVVVVRRTDDVTRKTSSLKKNKKKKKKKRSSLYSIWLSRRFISKRPRKKVFMFNGELKDMRKLSSNDEAFRLPWETLSEIINIIHSRKTPPPKTYRHWDEFAISFYLKMCTCFGVDYQHLEATPEKRYVTENQSLPEDIAKYLERGLLPETQPLPEAIEEYLEQTSVGFILKTLPWPWYEKEKHKEFKGPKQVFQPAAEGMSFDEYATQVAYKFEILSRTRIFEGAFDFGCYSSETERDRIPSHLYMLLKKAGEIMCLTKDYSKDLKMPEEKIRFFMTYFHSHLPRNFQYKRQIAVECFAGFHDQKVEPSYCLDAYTHYRYSRLLMGTGWDPRTRLRIQEMVDIMNIIHSRKTPTFWGLNCEEISFYCKLCSCFGIEYHRLEDASENDVCLMNMRQKEPLAYDE